ncbi:MAG TPA: redoxin domain-containing protein [Anaerolineales bacterium]|nr:redoxin domain-containing protein [Anaerolineales bacterium]
MNIETILNINQLAPDFTLPDLSGRSHTLSDLRGKIVIVNFWSAECPWAERADGLLASYLKDWADGVALMPIASNANESPQLLSQISAERDLPLVLHDRYHRVADLYGAQATPHLFVVDPEGMLCYQGALDDVTFRKREPSQHYLKAAVESVMAGRQPDPAQTPPYGCAIVKYD